MRGVATSLLALAALVYLLTLGRTGWVGFVNAAAEASMVGAVADWFAVTALFRHPLGLPVPHTALVPRRKEMLGRGLQEFVVGNFLRADVVRARALEAGISARVGVWLVVPGHARRVVEEAAGLLRSGLTRVRSEDVVLLLQEVVLPRLADEPVGPVAGRLLEEVVRDRAHHGLVDLGLAELHGWLLANEATFTRVVGERAPWWSPPQLNERVTARVYTEVVAWVEDIRADPHHRARLALDSALGQLARDLLHDPRTQQRAERLKLRILAQPQLLSTATSLWDAFRHALLDSLADPQGAVRERGVAELTAFGHRLCAEDGLRTTLDGHAAALSVFLVGRYGEELATVISHTVDRWDGRDAASRIELHVGRDLQFIRVNGTVVGGLVGVAIHAVSGLVR